VTTADTARGIHIVHVHEPVLINDSPPLFEHQEIDDNLNAKVI